MGLVGGYTLDLYCDGDNCPGRQYGDFDLDEGCQQFFGRNVTEAKADARHHGWRFGSEKCYCPKCTKAKKKPTTGKGT